MNLPFDPARLAAAHASIRRDLMQERGARGQWVGQLSSSPLSTATAISALILAEQSGTSAGLPAYDPENSRDSLSEIYQGDLSQLIVNSLNWLAGQQNEDGGWGDTDRSLSNIATTMLVQAAFHLTGVPAKYKDLLDRADRYVADCGGLTALKERYEGDRTFVVPILTNCALADMVPWRKVPALPFELACLPQKWYHKLNLPVVSYALPALVAIGQARFHHAPPRNPLLRWLRRSAQRRSLQILAEMQPASGGYLEAIPLTSFVVMSLASMGLGGHAVVRRGVEFLLGSVREDGSWPIDTNLASWNTSQVVSALDAKFDSAAEQEAPSAAAEQTLDWLLSCQHQQVHRATGAAPGGWAWTDLSGGIPDADDTAAALLALSVWRRRWARASYNRYHHSRAKRCPLATRPAEFRWRLAHVLSGLGSASLRSQQYRHHCPRPPRAQRLEARIDLQRTTPAQQACPIHRPELSSPSATTGWQLAAAVVRQSASPHGGEPRLWDGQSADVVSRPRTTRLRRSSSGSELSGSNPTRLGWLGNRQWRKCGAEQRPIPLSSIPRVSKKQRWPLKHCGRLPRKTIKSVAQPSKASLGWWRRSNQIGIVSRRP